MSAIIGDSTWWVYILKCNDGSLYCGITNNLERRLRQHSGSVKGGAKYTLSRRPCVLVYREQADNKSAALRREWEIKKMPKAAKNVLVEAF